MLVRIGRGIWWTGIGWSVIQFCVDINPHLGDLLGKTQRPVEWSSVCWVFISLGVVLGMTRLARYILAGE